MRIKSIWKWTKISYGILFILSIVGFVGVLAFLMFGMLRDDKALVNTAAMSSVTLLLGIASLPGVLVQLLSLLEINQKKTFTATKKCPNCKHAIDLKMTED